MKMCPIKKREYSEDIFIDVPYYPLPISSIADNQLIHEPQMREQIGKSDPRFDLKKFHAYQRASSQITKKVHDIQNIVHEQGEPNKVYTKEEKEVKTIDPETKEEVTEKVILDTDKVIGEQPKSKEEIEALNKSIQAKMKEIATLKAKIKPQSDAGKAQDQLEQEKPE